MIVDVTESNKEAAAEGIAALEADLFGRGAWNANMVREELDAPARTYVLDVDDARGARDADDLDASPRRPERAERAEGPHGAIGPSAIRGYAGFWYDGEDAEIMTIGVAKAHQRQGIAAAMLACLVGKAREQGARRMLLEVRVDNEPALALYRRFGFERMGLRKRYYQPEGIDAYTMSLDLAPRVVGFQPATAGSGEYSDQNGETR